MNFFTRFFSATTKAVNAAWHEGKYTFSVAFRGSQKQLSEGEAWIRAFEELDKRERKENFNDTQ